MSMTPYPKVEYNEGSDLPTLVFLAGFPDNELSSWGTKIPEHYKQTHHCVFFCLPGYEKGGKVTGWGYNFDELIALLNVSIEQSVPLKKKFTLISHDWGAHLALLYQNAYPDRVEKLVLIDVGMTTPFTMPIKHLFIITFYQVWFATTFVLYRLFGRTISLLYMALFFLPIFKWIHPTWDKPPVPTKEIRPDKCYPYFHLWKNLLTGRVKFPKFPSCPTLYLVSIHALSTLFKHFFVLIF